jgi:hypothetical protein
MLPKLKKSDGGGTSAKKLFASSNEAWKEMKQNVPSSGSGNNTARSNMTSLSSLSGNTNFTSLTGSTSLFINSDHINQQQHHIQQYSNLGEDEAKEERTISLFQKGNEEMEGLVPPKDNHDWVNVVGRIQRRPKGWMNRFANKIDERNIVTVPLTKMEEREQRILASGWQNVTYTKEDLAKLKPIEVKPVHMQPFPTELNDYAMNLCSFCGKLVSRGAHRVQCQHCSTVSHVQCIPNVESFVNQTKRQQNIQRHVNFDVQSSVHTNKYEDFQIVNNRAGSAANSSGTTGGASGSYSSSSTPKAKASSEKARPKSSVKVSTSPVVTSGKQLARPASSPHYKPNLAKKVSFCVSEHDYTTKDIHWVCHFCRHDKQYFEQTSQTQYETMSLFEKQTYASVKIQSVLRMYMARCQFLKVLKGVIIAQEIFRMKIFARKIEREKATRNYCYRLRLHEIKMIVSNQNSDEKFVMKFPTIPTYHNIGELRADTYEKHLQDLKELDSNSSSNNNTNTVGGGAPSSPTGPSRTSSVGTGINNAASMFTSTSASGPTIPFPLSHSNSFTSGSSPKKPRKNPMFDFLTHGHVDNPQYAKPLRGQSVPKGTLMLTISVHEYVPDRKAPIVALGSSADNHVNPSDLYQLYRYDLILKEVSKSNDISYSSLEKRGFANIDREIVDKLAQQYHMITYSTQRPYVLIPFSTANIEIRMTISEVREFPKANVIGFNRFYLSHYLTRIRIVSVNQTLSHPLPADIPLSDDSSKLAINIPKVSYDKKVRNKIPSYAKSSGKAPPTNSLVHKEPTEQRDYAQGILTWSLLPLGFSEFNECGFLTVLQDVSKNNTSIYLAFICIVYFVRFDAI